MKNSASNPSIIQALHAQAQQLLPTITHALSVLQYTEIVHHRLGQTNTARLEKIQNTQTQPIKKTDYQGLTRASHARFGRVMIKWQLEAHTSHDSSDLDHELHVLKSLNELSQNQNTQKPFVPSVLAYHKATIQALGQHKQLTALVMPHYPNGSLAKQLNTQRHSLLTEVQKYHFITQTAHLIAKLHNAGWLHNDIKPSNILLDGISTEKADNSNQTPYLLMADFAVAEYITSPSKLNTAGTPAYLAPERWQGQGATIQSDIYAFGIMMVEILMGVRPFNINTQSSDPMVDWAIQHCQQPVPKLPSEYNHYQFIVDKALAKRVGGRYQGMDAILEALKNL